MPLEHMDGWRTRLRPIASKSTNPSLIYGFALVFIWLLRGYRFSLLVSWGWVWSDFVAPTGLCVGPHLGWLLCCNVSCLRSITWECFELFECVFGATCLLGAAAHDSSCEHMLAPYIYGHHSGYVSPILCLYTYASVCICIHTSYYIACSAVKEPTNENSTFVRRCEEIRPSESQNAIQTKDSCVRGLRQSKTYYSSPVPCVGV